MTLEPGTAVRVRLDWPETRGPCHIRTPHYVRGQVGTVLRHLGDFPNPEALAFDRPAEIRSLYHVGFPCSALWPPARPNQPDDDIVIELFAHWLEAA